MNKTSILTALFLVFSSYLFSQNIKGVIKDKRTKETLIGANIQVINGTGVTSDIDGNFELKNISNLPITIRCSYIGYKTKNIEITSYNFITINLQSDDEQLQEVQIRDTRLTERLKQSPITIESLDINAIKETPSSSFYEGLSNLKGVDLTSASLGFKIINTRGFNSTSPVRSLQLIDGVDKKSPEK